jgi:P-type Ca2+ transporter type 2C
MPDVAGFRGLSQPEVEAARTQYGPNALPGMKRQTGLARALSELIREPMFILLLATSAIYFVSGAVEDGLFMVMAIVIVAAISLYQDARSRNALAALHALTRPKATVIRDGIITEIDTEALVPGDIMRVEEGTPVPADGIIVQANDFFVNESMLSGESVPLGKNERSADNLVFQGTTVTGGLALCRVTATGAATRLGQIGLSMEAIEEVKTPLQLQVSRFVRNMAIIGLVVFALVWILHYVSSGDVLESLLHALTLAMSILPEEIPVAFTTFMALGAWRLMKSGIIVKQMKTVEALGSASVICTDKTGTITENKMTLASVFIPRKGLKKADDPEARPLIRAAMWASEPIPFDPMEIALHSAYAGMYAEDERPAYRLVHEYPLAGVPPMMTHVFDNEAGQRIIAAKGAPEAIFAVSGLDAAEEAALRAEVHQLAAEGYRVLGVGLSDYGGQAFPEQQQALPFHFEGLLAFYDPPKPHIRAVFEQFDQAGIEVKIITGDYPATTVTIARQTGFRQRGPVLEGAGVMALSDEALQTAVAGSNIFARMFPEAKLRVITALQAAGHMVAMTGDGVNDGPALKAAHIGIAMGKKGTETARRAASLILMHDDLSAMVEAVAMGRKIYDNLKKAIQYIISIHIPIILTVLLPLSLGWAYPAIFTPVHVIFLELIMGPTCSIVFENEPMEAGTMKRAPRPFSTTFFHFRELLTSIIQGLAITVGVLLMYQYAVGQGMGEDATRTTVFVTLISANIVLTLVNRSFVYPVLTTVTYRNPLIPLVLGATALLTALLLAVPLLRELFQFTWIGWPMLGKAVLAGMLSVLWYELVKLFRQSNISRKQIQ